MVNNNVTPGAMHLANNPHLYSPQRTNNFELHISGLDSLKRINTSEMDDNHLISNAAEVIRFSLVSSFVPSFSQSVIEVHYGNNRIKFAGKPEWGSGSFVINDMIGADGKSAIYSWQSLSYDPDGQLVGNAENYKKTAHILEYNSDYSKLVRSWKLIGCWLSEVSEDPYSMENDSKKTVTATVQYDMAKLEVY